VRWRRAGVGHRSCYEAPFSMRFDPTDMAQRGELTYGVFEWQGGDVGCVMVASSLRPWPAARSSSDQPPASTMGWEASHRSPLAPLPVQLLQKASET
jgi:hypothetical protein